MQTSVHIYAQTSVHTRRPKERHTRPITTVQLASPSSRATWTWRLNDTFRSSMIKEVCTLQLKLMHNVHSVYIFCILCTLCTKQMSYKMLCTFVGTHLQFDIILCTLELVCTCTLSVLVTLTPQKCLKMFKIDQTCSV